MVEIICCYNIITKNIYRLGLVYFGFGPFKAGFNSEKIRVYLQNDLIHKPGQRKHPGSFFLWNDLSSQYPDRFYWYIGSTGGSSLW